MTHPNFAQWYKTIDLEADPARIQKRLQGVIASTESIKRQDLEACLRTIYNIVGIVQPDARPKIKDVFKKLDDTFDETNQREMEILCGAILAISCEKNGHTSACTALAIASSYARGARSYNLPMPLIELSDDCLHRNSELERKRPDVSKIGFPNPKIDFAVVKTTLQAGVDAANLGIAFDELHKAIQKALNDIAEEGNEAFEEACSFVVVQDEELDMLWWIFGERSFDFNVPFKDLSFEQKPLILGKELADCTVKIPGRPITINNLLARAGLERERKLTIPQAVNACDLDWLATLNIRPGLPLSAPIHFAMQKRLETGETASWVAGWSAITGIAPEVEISHLEIGELFYNERLLSKFMVD